MHDINKREEVPERLKPCPFCGSAALLRERGGLWAAMCSKHCAVTRGRVDKNNAIRVWNRRTEK